MYKEVTIRNFRGIKSLTLKKLGRINIFVGKNNSGKTTILEGIFLLTGPGNPNLPLNINVFRGLKVLNETTWSVLYNNLDIDHDIELEGKLINPEENRKLFIKPLWNTENPTNKGDSIEKKASGSTNFKGSIQGLNLEFHLNGPSKKKFSSSIKLILGKLDTNPDSTYKNSIDGVFLSPTTMYLDLPRNLEQQIIKKKSNAILEILHRIEPSITGIQLGLEKSIICDIGLPSMLPLEVLGEGIKRFLALTIAIAEHPNGIICIDEIENGLYSDSLSALLEAIIGAPEFNSVQLFASTHSLDCLNALTHIHSINTNTNDVLVHRVERSDNATQIISMNLDELTTALESGWEVR